MRRNMNITNANPSEVIVAEVLLFFWGLGLGYVEIKQLNSSGFQVALTKWTDRRWNCWYLQMTSVSTLNNIEIKREVLSRFLNNRNFIKVNNIHKSHVKSCYVGVLWGHLWQTQRTEAHFRDLWNWLDAMSLGNWRLMVPGVTFFLVDLAWAIPDYPVPSMYGIFTDTIYRTNPSNEGKYYIPVPWMVLVL